MTHLPQPPKKRLFTLYLGPWQFQSSWFLLLCFILLFCVFLSLGQWQFNKAKQRQLLELEIDRLNRLSTEKPFTLSEADQHYNKVFQGLNDSHGHVQGQFLFQKHILLDNRIQNGQAGYEVLGFFDDHDDGIGPHLVVNLGWHPFINNQRTPYPSVTLPSKPLTLTGRYHVPPSGLFTLNDKGLWESSSHLILPNLDLQYLSQDFQFNLYPFILRYAQSVPEIQLGAPIINKWAPLKEIGISADKHLGYAFQWWCFALILIGIYGFQSVKSDLKS